MWRWSPLPEKQCIIEGPLPSTAKILQMILRVCWDHLEWPSPHCVDLFLLVPQAPQMQVNKHLNNFTNRVQKKGNPHFDIWRHRQSRGRRMMQMGTRQGADRDLFTQRGKRVSTAAPTELAGQCPDSGGTDCHTLPLKPSWYTSQSSPWSRRHLHTRFVK